MASDIASVESSEVNPSESDFKAKLQTQDEKLSNLTLELSKLTANVDAQRRSSVNNTYDSRLEFHSVRLDSLGTQMTDMMNTVKNMQDVFLPIVNGSNQKKEEEQSQMLEVRLCSMSQQMESLMVDMKSMQSTLENVQFRMNREEKKENDSDVRKEIEGIKETLKGLVAAKKVKEVDSEKEAFRKWMVNTLKLPEYTDVFIENGIENLNVVRMLTQTELNQIGISKIGHRMQIMRAISMLNGNGLSIDQHAVAKAASVSEGTGTPFL